MTTTSFLIDRIVMESTDPGQPITLVVRVSGDRLYLDVLAAETGPANPTPASHEATLAAYAVDAAPAQVVAVPTRSWRRARTTTPTRPASTSRLLGVYGHRSPELDTDVVIGPASWRRWLLVGSVAATIVLCGVGATVMSRSDAMLVTPPTTTSTVLRTDPLDALGLGPADREYVEAIMAMTPEQLAATVGTGPHNPKSAAAEETTIAPSGVPADGNTGRSWTSSDSRGPPTIRPIDQASPSLHAAGIERTDHLTRLHAIYERCGGLRDGSGC
jgi:hypothetical protein